MLKLSVIIPVYNVEKYIAKCLDSVVCCDGADYEIIVVNDGSTDSSGRLAEAYAEKYPQLVRVISTPNRGLGPARNLGIAQAQGEYVFCIDSDDYLIEGGMRAILDTVERGSDIVLFDAVSVREDGSELWYIPGSKRTERLTLDEYPGLLLEIPNVWNKVVRRSLYTDNGIEFPAIWFEDLATMLRLYSFARSVEYLPEPLYRYVQRPQSITNSKKTARNAEIITALDELIGFYRERGEYDRLHDELEYLAFHSQFLTASIRVNLADRRSPLQDRLIDDYVTKFPDYEDNPYLRTMPLRHRLLAKLLKKRRYLAVHLLMKLNNVLKRKNL